MRMTMNEHVKVGEGVQDEINKGVDEIVKIGDEYKDVKEQLQDMPELDPDLSDMIENAKDIGKEEALQDIDATNRSVIESAKRTADNLKSDVHTKISDNTTANNKLDGISSKYGRNEINQARTAIENNTKIGEDLLRTLDDAIKDADQNIDSVKGGL